MKCFGCEKPLGHIYAHAQLSSGGELVDICGNCFEREVGLGQVETFAPHAHSTDFTIGFGCSAPPKATVTISDVPHAPGEPKCHDCGEGIAGIQHPCCVRDPQTQRLKYAFRCSLCHMATEKLQEMASGEKPKGRSYTTVIADDTGRFCHDCGAHIDGDAWYCNAKEGDNWVSICRDCWQTRQIAPSGQKGFTMNLFEYAVLRVVDGEITEIVIPVTSILAKDDRDVQVKVGIVIGEKAIEKSDELVVRARPFGG